MEAFKAGNVININDEWAHVPCYNIETLKSDPNVVISGGKASISCGAMPTNLMDAWAVPFGDMSMKPSCFPTVVSAMVSGAS